jgi:ketosteroid isomerase-like protein
MPLYDARCTECGSVKEIFRAYEKRDEDLPVCACGQQMARVFIPPQVMRDIEPYQSMVTGEMIGGRSAHREHLKRHGLRELGTEKPELKPMSATVPREALRAELRNTVEAMKAGGRFRER